MDWEWGYYIGVYTTEMDKSLLLPLPCGDFAAVAECFGHLLGLGLAGFGFTGETFWSDVWERLTVSQQQAVTDSWSNWVALLSWALPTLMTPRSCDQHFLSVAAEHM